MDVERTIDDIEQLEEMFEALDIRPLSPNDISAANRRHDEALAHTLVRTTAIAAKTVRGMKWARVAELEMELDGKKIVKIPHHYENLLRR